MLAYINYFYESIILKWFHKFIILRYFYEFAISLKWVYYNIISASNLFQTRIAINSKHNKNAYRTHKAL